MTTSLFPESLAPSADAAPFEYVGFRRRALARLIDIAFHYVIGAIAGVVIVMIAIVLQRLGGRPASLVIARMQEEDVLMYLFAMAGGFLYEALMEGLHGSTLGKLLTGIVVLREDDGRPCGMTAAAKRALAIYFDGLLFGLVADFSMRKDEKRQRYGDHWAKTIVVRRRSAPRASLRSGLRFAAVLLLAMAADGAFIGAKGLLALVG